MLISGGVGGSTINQLAPQLTNVRPANTLKWRRGKAYARAGTRNARIAFVGDSTTGGVGAVAPFNVPELFGVQAKALGWNVYAEHLWGELDQTDSRLNTGSWVGALSTAGGGMKSASGAGTPLSYTPTQAFDTIVVSTPQNGPLGSFRVDVDGGASLGTINQSGSSALVTTTFTVPLGLHTVNLTWVSGAAYLSSLRMYDSTKKGLEIANMGVSGIKAGGWTNQTQPWDNLLALKAYAPDLTIINLGINDIINGPTTVASYTASMTTIVNGAKVSGDVVLVVPEQTGDFAAIHAAIRGLSATLDVPMYDLSERWVSAAAISAGMPEWMADSIHPSGNGYTDIVEGLAPFIRA